MSFAFGISTDIVSANTSNPADSVIGQFHYHVEQSLDYDVHDHEKQ